MKKFLNSLLGVIVFIPLVFISCVEKDVNPPPKDMCPNLPGIQTSSADCPPLPTGEKPVVTASNPAKGWFNGTIVGTFGVTSADSITGIVIKANGVVIPNEAGYSYTLNNVKGPVQVEIAVTNKNGTTTAYANADVFDEQVTDLCSTGMWKMTKERYSSDSIVWNVGTPTCFPTEFRTDWKCTIFMSMCSGGGPDSPNAPWSFSTDRQSMKWGQQFYKKILVKGPNKMIFVWENPSPTVTQWVEETWEH